MTQPIGPPGSDGRWNIDLQGGPCHAHPSRATSSAPAAAAPVAVGGGVTNLHLDRATAAALGELGLSVAPVGPATASGARSGFPVTGGSIDPATAAGRVSHSGGLAFSAGGARVRVGDFIVRTDRRLPVLTAAVGSAGVPLLALDLGDAEVLRRGPGGVGTWVVRVRTSLTATAAAALNGAFGTHLAAGTPIGRGRPARRAVPGAAGGRRHHPRPRPGDRGGAHRPAPGTAGPAGLSSPVTGGSLAAGALTGTVAHRGGIALTAGATRVELTGFRIALGPTPRLTAAVNGGATRVPLAVDLAGARTGLSSRTAVVRGARMLLTSEAASAQNAAFGVTALTAGLPLGTADVRAEVRSARRPRRPATRAGRRGRYRRRTRSAAKPARSARITTCA